MNHHGLKTYIRVHTSWRSVLATLSQSIFCTHSDRVSLSVLIPVYVIVLADYHVNFYYQFLVMGEKLTSTRRESHVQWMQVSNLTQEEETRNSKVRPDKLHPASIARRCACGWHLDFTSCPIFPMWWIVWCNASPWFTFLQRPSPFVCSPCLLYRKSEPEINLFIPSFIIPALLIWYHLSSTTGLFNWPRDLWEKAHKLTYESTTNSSLLRIIMQSLPSSWIDIQLNKILPDVWHTYRT